jgi:type II secretory pathway pseudopilin PulG
MSPDKKSFTHEPVPTYVGTVRGFASAQRNLLDQETTIARLPQGQLRRRSFTLIEALITAAILSLVGIGLFYAVAKKDSFYDRNMANIDLQAQLRTTLDFIANDVRQTSSWDIANNEPTPTHIKFRKVLGINTLTSGYLYENNYIQYDYSSSEKRITRSIVDASGNIISRLNFGNIVNGIAIDNFSFSTYNSAGGVVLLNKDDLLYSKKLITAFRVEKKITGSATLVNLSSSEEVKIRND